MLCLSGFKLYSRWVPLNEHITRFGKHIANKDHHSVTTSLRKAKTFLEDEYLHEIMAASDQHFLVQS